MTQARCPWTFKPLEAGVTVSPYTNRELPEGWTDAVTHCVAMAGARNSGKSLYTAVMIKQLKQLAHKHDRSVQPADESTRERYAEVYEKPLFEEMRAMDPTPSAVATDAYQRDPLIFELGVWPDEQGQPRMNYLVFRDVAGEDLENPPENEADRENLAFFSHADLVIFLFDPLRVKQIQDFIHGLIPNIGELGADSLRVLDNLLDLLDTDTPPPLAVTISKFDTVQKLEQVDDVRWKKLMSNRGAAFRRDTGWNFNDSDRYMVHLEAESLLRFLGANDLINKLYSAAPREGSFFVVSALGEAPTGRQLARSGIAPYRVLDPIRWQLKQRGVFAGDVS